MAQRMSWDELSRAHQRLLARLWGGGSIRGQDPDVILGLRLMGYLADDGLTRSGEELCADALIATVGRIAGQERAERFARL